MTPEEMKEIIAADLRESLGKYIGKPTGTEEMKKAIAADLLEVLGEYVREPTDTEIAEQIIVTLNISTKP